MIAHRFHRCLAAFGMVAGLAFAALDVRTPPALNVLQMNLCNSGSGLSVILAVG